MQKLSRLIQKSESGDSINDPVFRSEILHLRKELSKVQSDYEDILQDLKLSNPSYNEIVSAHPVNLPDLQKKLDRNTASLVYWISDDRIILWLVTSGEVFSTSVEINSKDLTSLVEKTRRSIQSNIIEESDLNLALLYKYLVLPVEKRLAGFTNLVIVPNGALHFLPFQALRDGKGEYLVQKYNIIYEPSAGVYILCNERQALKGSRFLGFALSEVSVGGKAGLPGTSEEVKKILELFPDNLSAFGSSGSETFVKKNAAKFNFIHFATHGSYNFSQPLYSCLLFPPSDEDDGRLNVYEVLEMDLNAKLVTLSACETGLGNLNRGDELIGLSRAFLFAGSSSVLVSLWAVADYQTSMLMTSFYGHLKDHSVQEALTLAQREVIKKFPQPLYWSPFILIGNGTVTAD
jgi:CHAT domain-containing protein